jgi:hypothetical protein
MVQEQLQGSPQEALHFLSDPSSCSQVIAAAQAYGEVLYTISHYISRVFCHGNHTMRKKLLSQKGIL